MAEGLIGMDVKFPGLLVERLPSGNHRYRVRVEGNPAKRIRIHVGPDHDSFSEHYHSARRGIEIMPDETKVDAPVRGSLAWLIDLHLAAMERQVELKLASPKTLKKRRLLLGQARAEYGEYDLDMPPSQIVKFRDSMAATPAWADSMVEALRTMFRWSISNGHCDVNPAVGIGKIDPGKGGATPWTVEDLKQYRDHHRPGTMAFLCLTLFMFTACRIGDAVVLGRSNEFRRHGVQGVGWQPQKKGSAKVEIPMLPPLYRATRDATVVGPTYLLTTRGKPFKSPDVLGQTFRRWCREAGLENRSSHGIRKAAGHLLALEGCSQYQIMSIHGHTQAKTSEIYTEGVERWRLAADAMRTLESMEW